MNNTANTLPVTRSEKEPIKLKFGIERLLSDDKKHVSGRVVNGGEYSNSSKDIVKPVPTVAVPCSDCVTSLFRCCTGGNSPRYLGDHHHSGGAYAVQPIRPFATRPGVRMHVTRHQSPPPAQLGGHSKRKRSWSRAVFSNLQRKGLERRFQLQKYITKPDRRQLAATLGLTDAQVKVWFQNRRMKWRHTKESAKIAETAADSTQDQDIHIDVDTITDDVD